MLIFFIFQLLGWQSSFVIGQLWAWLSHKQGTGIKNRACVDMCLIVHDIALILHEKPLTAHNKALTVQKMPSAIGKLIFSKISR